jgi:hypothetical protein
MSSAARVRLLAAVSERLAEELLLVGGSWSSEASGADGADAPATREGGRSAAKRGSRSAGATTLAGPQHGEVLAGAARAHGCCPANA